MFLSLFNFCLALILPTLVFFIAFILAMRSNLDREKSSPFECGFDPKNKARIPFSTRFFLLAIIFLVFDIEIALLMPIPTIIFYYSTIYPIFGAIIFFFILLLGLIHE